MTGYLLDTHIALLGLSEPERIPIRIREAVEGAPTYLSVLSYWEVLLKSMKGKLDVGEPRVWWIDALAKFGATALYLRPDHISAILELPPIHHDPFDRGLIAQSSVEALTLVTNDSDIQKYASDRFQVLF